MASARTTISVIYRAVVDESLAFVYVAIDFGEEQPLRRIEDRKWLDAAATQVGMRWLQRAETGR